MMTDQEKARRIAELQRQSQSLDPSNPMTLVPPSGDREPDDVSLAGPDGVAEEAPPKAPMRIPSDEEIKSRMAKQAQDARTNTLRTIPMAGAKAVAGQRQRQKDFGAMSGGAPTPDEPAPGLDSMTPETLAQLRAKYENSGHTQTMPFEDWYADNFAGSQPEDVSKAAAATVRIQPGKDPRLEPGQNSAVAKSRLAAGKPLPEGRDASQYGDKQRRTMQRNIHSPEVPMTRFGGTFTHNVDGSVSSRAPNQEMLDLAKEIAADQGAGSASHTMALAQAYGIDATQYGDDMDLLQADVAREHKRHHAMAGKYTIEKNPMGGYVYVPSQQMRDTMQARRTDQFADEVVGRHEGLLTPEERASIETYATTQDGFAQLRELNNRLNRRSLGLRNQNVRNNWANRNMTIAANNPRVAQGLYMRSLQEAAQSGDPMQVAAVHSSFGNDRAARDYMSLAAQQGDAAATVAAAEASAREKAQDSHSDKTFAQQFQDEINSALANADPAQRRVLVVGILNKMGVIAPEQVEKTADAIIASASGGSLNPQHTRTWMEYFFGPRQAEQGPSIPPQQAQAGAAPPAPPTTPAPPPAPASGRGASLDSFYNFLTNPPALPPNPNHPYRRGS
jgi:hypothetical protein